MFRSAMPWMHGYVGLSAIGMAQDLVATTLSHFNKSARKSLARTSRAENGIGDLDLRYQRLGFDALRA